MFKIHINDGSKVPDDDIYYIVAKEGLFLKKKLGIMESLVPVKNVSILNSVQTNARMHISKIPAVMFAKTVSFFKEVYKQCYSEAIVLLFYNEQSKKYKIIVPDQKVSGSSCDYNRKITIKNYNMIGDIHSHASMSAFHSGTDSDDEKSFDGLHITIGNISDDSFSISCSIVSNGTRFITEPENYISGIKKVKDENKTETRYLTKVYRTINGKLQIDEKANKAYSTKITDKKYISTVPSSKSIFNKDWLEKVTRQHPIVNRGNFSYGFYGSKYDASLWDRKPPLPRNVVLPKKKEINENNLIPCISCLYKDLKIELDEEGLLDEQFYKCDKCGTIFEEDDINIKAMVCPECFSDNIKPVTEVDLRNNYVEEENFIKCSHCGNEVDINKFMRCPFCYEKLENYNSEENLIKQSQHDSGFFLDNQDEINQEALKQNLVEKIPDPVSKNIPIPQSITTNRKPTKNIIKRLFRKE